VAPTVAPAAEKQPEKSPATPAPTTETPLVAVPVAGTQPPKKEVPREVPPTTQPIAASTPVLSVPPVGARPTVESFTEEEYVVKPNDTFESISKQFYQTPDYAEALRLYNRNDSLLSDLGRDGTGTLKTGQHLSIPRQWEILKKRYGETIPAVRPAGVTTPPGSETSNKVALPPKEAAPPAPKPVTYRVPAGEGQAMYDIAKTLLGNGERWTEIRNLNQQYDPLQKIPAGKEVRLPADASSRVAATAVVEQR
jgi:nucleoid-associated protein YgaU